MAALLGIAFWIPKTCENILEPALTLVTAAVMAEALVIRRVSDKVDHAVAKWLTTEELKEASQVLGPYTRTYESSRLQMAVANLFNTQASGHIRLKLVEAELEARQNEM